MDMENNVQGLETQQEVNETIEKVKQQARPEVYDDFSEDFEVPNSKGNSTVLTILLSTIFSTILTLAIIFGGGAGVNALQKKQLGKDIQGAWLYDIGTEYYGQAMYVYLVFENGKFTMAMEEGSKLLEGEYEVTEKNEIKLSGENIEMATMQGMLTSKTIEVVIEKEKVDGKEAEKLILNPGIGMISEWDRATEEELRNLKTAIETYVDPNAGSYGDVSEQQPSEGAVAEPVMDENGNLIDPATGEIIVPAQEIAPVEGAETAPVEVPAA